MQDKFIDLLVTFNLLVISFIFFTYLEPQVDQNLGEYESQAQTAYFHQKEVSVPPEKVISDSQVLGEATAPKKIYVDLNKQRIYAFEGNRLVYNFLVSTGKWGRTPTGVFNIWVKLRYSKMEGGSKQLGTYYYLPNVPYVMYFYNNQYPRYRGFGIHGTYWHNNFGHPMSHGCVNMKTSEAAKLYHWAGPDTRARSYAYATNDNPGTQVVIFGRAPSY
jgi:lipoprotein-anchoring transpeptidase ErfK/SrfK